MKRVLYFSKNPFAIPTEPLPFWDPELWLACWLVPNGFVPFRRIATNSLCAVVGSVMERNWTYGLAVLLVVVSIKSP